MPLANLGEAVERGSAAVDESLRRYRVEKEKLSEKAGEYAATHILGTYELIRRGFWATVGAMIAFFVVWLVTFVFGLGLIGTLAGIGHSRMQQSSSSPPPELPTFSPPPREPAPAPELSAAEKKAKAQAALRLMTAHWDARQGGNIIEVRNPSSIMFNKITLVCGGDSIEIGPVSPESSNTFSWDGATQGMRQRQVAIVGGEAQE